MIRGELKELSLFDKANAAAKAAMRSVVDLASRTSTPVIVFRNGQIERLSPAAIVDQQVGEEQPSKSSNKES
jgi:hypothetical protein